MQVKRGWCDDKHTLNTLRLGKTPWKMREWGESERVCMYMCVWEIGWENGESACGLWCFEKYREEENERVWESVRMCVWESVRVRVRVCACARVRVCACARVRVCKRSSETTSSSGWFASRWTLMGRYWMERRNRRIGADFERDKRKQVKLCGKVLVSKVIQSAPQEYSFVKWCHQRKKRYVLPSYVL